MFINTTFNCNSYILNMNLNLITKVLLKSILFTTTYLNFIFEFLLLRQWKQNSKKSHINDQDIF